MAKPPDSVFSMRLATTDDLSAILEIERKVHVAPWNEANFCAELEKAYSQMLVFTDDETDTAVAAYLVMWSLMDQCQILNIAVDLPYRGQGYAKKLVQKAIQLAMQAEADKITLEVRKSNTAAILLYQSLGFSITHLRKGFYSNGEDAYLMTFESNKEL